MTETPLDLKPIEARLQEVYGRRPWLPNTEARLLNNDVPDLVAEVRRLREEDRQRAERDRGGAPAGTAGWSRQTLAG